MERWDIEPPPYLQTPHFPPSFAQCLQYLQFLQAWQGSAPVQVAAKMSNESWLMRSDDNKICERTIRNRDFTMVISSEKKLRIRYRRSMYRFFTTVKLNEFQDAVR